MSKSTNLVVSVCGAGHMGTGIARRLLSRGFKVRIYNRTLSRIARDLRKACIVAKSPAECAESADVIISVVSDDRAAQELWFGDGGIVEGASKRAVSLELSTLSVAFIDSWHRHMRRLGLRAVDTPVTGSRPAVDRGDLAVFAGAKNLGRAGPILDALASRVHLLGAPGRGMRVKLAYNMVGASLYASFAEGLKLVEAMGLDLRDSLAVFRETGWTMHPAGRRGEYMRRRKYSPAGFTAELMAKDVAYALAAGGGLKLPIAKTVGAQYAAVARNGYALEDFSAVREFTPKVAKRSRKRG